MILLVSDFIFLLAVFLCFFSKKMNIYIGLLSIIAKGYITAETPLLSKMRRGVL